MNGLVHAWRTGLAALVLAVVAPAHAATDTQTASFNFVHTGTVSTGVISVLATFTNAVATTANAPVPQFDPAKGRLTQVTVTVATTTSTFAVTPTGLLSLLGAASATRRLTYGLVSGSATATNFNEVATSGSALLTLLPSTSTEIGGAPLSASATFTATTDLAAFTGTGTVATTMTATDTTTVTTAVSVGNGAGINGTGTYAGTVTVAYQYTPWAISGYVYKDANHDGFKGAGEAGTGLALTAKLVLKSSGLVVATTAVDPSTGAYAFAATAGSYQVVIDDNALTSDTTPLVPPAGWSATQSPSRVRDVTVAGNPVSQDFGLVQATAIAGRLFLDNGASGGTANDGVRNGAEPGLAGRTVQVTDTSGNVVDTAITDPAGAYALYVTSSTANGATLRVLPAAAPGAVTTGASVGTTGGSFSRALGAVVFAFSNAQAYSGVDLGSVTAVTLTPGETQAGQPGAVLFLPHRLTALTAGSVALSTSHVAPSGVSWSETVYVDTNGNGVIDPGESPLAGPLALVAGQVVNLVLKVALPAGAAGQRLETQLRADMTLANTSPGLVASTSAIDYAIVVAPDGGEVTLIKSASTATALPGGTVVYTIRFLNAGTKPVTNLVINDQTPSYTVFASAAAATLPAAMSTASVALPSAGAAGGLQWTFNGTLAPSAEGSVQFTVTVSP